MLVFILVVCSGIQRFPFDDIIFLQKLCLLFFWSQLIWLKSETSFINLYDTSRFLVKFLTAYWLTLRKLIMSPDIVTDLEFFALYQRKKQCPIINLVLWTSRPTELLTTLRLVYISPEIRENNCFIWLVFQLSFCNSVLTIDLFWSYQFRIVIQNIFWADVCHSSA